MDDIFAEQHPDKEYINLVKESSKLLKYYKSRSEELDESIQYVGNVLSNTKETDHLIEAELHLEERSKSHDPTKFICSPRWTVLSTKFKLCEIYQNYTTANLFVLFRRTIVKDWMYLRECGVERNGDALYVYVFFPKPRPPLTIQSQTLQSGSDGTADMALMPNTNLLDPSFSFAEMVPNNPGSFEFPSDKDFSLPAPPDGMGKLWVCSACTFLNENWRNDCCMCSSPRQDNNSWSALPAGTSEFPLPLPPREQFEELSRKGWKCPGCTYLNEPTRPGCEMCAVQRPDNYEVPKDHVPSEKELERIRKEKELEQAAEEQRSLERRENYTKLLSIADQTIIHSQEPVECMICFTEADPTDSIVLRECLHRFCKDCICEHIKKSEDAVVSCPFMDDQYKCNNAITHQEIKALLPEDDFKKFLDRGLMQAEKESPNSFHCKTPDCNGWCVYEDQVNNFLCPVCKQTNCLICKAIHEGKNCKEYQDELTRKAATDEEAKKTKLVIEKMLKSGEAMHCPQCNIIIQKKVGCDWVRCPMCKLEICWVTKGPRWGPGGHGDTSGGCRCRVGGKRCHNDCNNCH